MPAEKKIPLQSSNNANVAPAPQGPRKTIEEVYQKKTQLEHILLRPDTYIGSVEKHTQNLWVWENDEMVNRSVSYVPGLYKIFDEILVNAADNKQRDPSMNSLKVVIDAEQNLISVYNNGNGVPVEIHQEEKVYVPELIFGHLLTSSNYDDNEKKTTGGRNGYGAKLTNIFSTEFVIETADGNRQKKYKQVFSENMGKKSDPVIGKGKSGECWTKVSFKPDLAKFNMAYLEEDVVALMRKRVIDMAGCLGKTVKVELNGVRVPVKTFAEYVELYLSSAKKSRTTETLDKFFFEDSNKRWEVCISVSEGQFQQVSFVNGIATIKGGTHVDYVTNQIANHLMTVVNKKNKNANIKAHNVKNHMWVFVNALIDNPAFDSQTKETLTLRHSSFGSKCEISEDFLKRVAKSTIVDALLSWANFKQNKDLKKTDGTKTGRIQDCPKLEDANLAGGKDSTKCTLILTEGDSAKALAVAGLSVVGRDYYGVFPLRGKLLNVREASPKQLNENKEIINIKKILGLQHGKDYDNVKSLRYGHLMIMTDQDHDGSHIKGLLINFIHAFWPSLLKVPSFMVEFITPIVKATHRNKTVMTFYTMPEYESWKESLGGNASSWTIKYYKGLGTSTAQEGKEYFSALTKHKKDFVWKDEQDAEAIELAFSKKKIEARKNWLRQFEPGTYLDQRDSLITYSDFINKELILFSRADLQRSIPSMLDGLKPGQRKILFCSFKKNLVKEQKVAQFVGYASEHSAYHHGETSLAGTIIGMAQDFVGSNNINLLLPNGQFGTRYTGGKDHASARYIYTCLSPVTRFLFPKEDDVLLDYLNEDGQSIEPNWYMPVIPTVLVNGCEGIGTGWSSYIPNYNPRDIIANLKRLLDGEMMVPMDPWYRKFKGTIEKIAVRDGVGSYIVSGAIEEIDETTIHITELPVRKWTQDYKEFLETLQGPDKADPFIKGFMEHHTDTRVEFRIVLSEENLMLARQEGLLKKFKLTSSISLNNMHLFDSTGVIKKYENPEQILEEFYHIRFEYYLKRRKVTLENLELELLKLENKVRFILGVVNGEIIVNNRKRVELVLELQSKGFTPFPKKKSPEAAVAGSTTDDTEEKEEDVTPSNGVRVSDYEYLLSLAISTLTLEKVQELCANRDKLSEDVEEMRRATPEYLWRKDLDALEKALDEQDERDAIAEKESIGKKEERGAAKKFSKPVARKNTKKPIIKGETVETSTSAMETDTVTEVEVKPKGRAAPRKAPAKKEKPIVLRDEEDDDDEVMELKDRLAAYNLDSSPDQSAAAMEAEVPAKKKAPVKRTTAAQKKASATITMLSDDENQVNEDSEVVAAPKKGGRKAAAAKPPAAAKKRGPAKKQQLLTDMMKPAEAAVASPEKKVRKMRASPFNKKSSSILGRIGNDKDEDASGSQENSGAASTPGSGELSDAVPAGPRPRRTNVRQVKYISSDSEGNDSDFSEEANLSEEEESEDDE